jgi:hypothetical protein
LHSRKGAARGVGESAAEVNLVLASLDLEGDRKEDVGDTTEEVK